MTQLYTKAHAHTRAPANTHTHTQDADDDEDGALVFEEFLLSYAKPKPVWKNLVIMAANTLVIFLLLQASGLGAQGGAGLGCAHHCACWRLVTGCPKQSSCGRSGASHFSAVAIPVVVPAQPLTPCPPNPPHPHPQSPLDVMLKCVLVGALILRPQIISRPACIFYDAIAALIGTGRARAEVARSSAEGSGRPSVWRAA